MQNLQQTYILLVGRHPWLNAAPSVPHFIAADNLYAT